MTDVAERPEHDIDADETAQRPGEHGNREATTEEAVRKRFKQVDRSDERCRDHAGFETMRSDGAWSRTTGMPPWMRTSSGAP